MGRMDRFWVNIYAHFAIVTSENGDEKTHSRENKLEKTSNKIVVVMQDLKRIDDLFVI
jgi:hypothetical protein